MSTHKIGFYGEVTKISSNYHQILTLSVLEKDFTYVCVTLRKASAIKTPQPITGQSRFLKHKQINETKTILIAWIKKTKICVLKAIT